MFDLRTARDFYVMLVEDFDDFMSEPHSARRALHCAITAYHLRESVWHDWIERDAVMLDTLCICDQGSFNAWVNRTCIWFPIVRELTNGAKHFERDRNFETMVVRAAPFGLDVLGAGLDEGSFDGPIPVAKSEEPDREGRLIMDFGEVAGEHRWYPAAHVLEAVVRFWRDFFKKYSYSSNIPVSRHHVDYQHQVEAL
jgi:hypothetical protein